MFRWSPDDKLLAITNGCSVTLVDTATGRAIREDNEPKWALRHLAVSPPAGRCIAAVERHWASGICLWKADETGRFTASRVGKPDEKVNGLAFVDAATLVSNSPQAGLSWWDAADNRLIRTMPSKFPERNFAVMKVSLSPDGRTAAFVVDDSIRLVDTTTSEDRTLVNAGARFTESLLFTRDGTGLIYHHRANGVGQIKLHNILKPESRNLLGYVEHFPAFAISPDEKQLVTRHGLMDTNTGKSRLTVFDIASGAAVSKIEVAGENLQTPAFSPDGRLLACGSSVRTGKDLDQFVGGALHIWRVNGKSLLRLPLDSPVCGLQFTADGKRLVTAHLDTSILVWDVQELLKR